ncbi:hypothetical protein DSC45_03795 [Streptomyces sp. YIM 130001]|uniref:hypothetical protein n=1 Tax=Streptomyces sp. YIM 130001 TaxID=2259644 RepID=UPI000E6475D6|nr:hypothetical protein [Streptomyces sp. YIM 130001]RII20325.1 hypothetical protein DSC45_03795 [Streptomyces sp. YIM 130001]
MIFVIGMVVAFAVAIGACLAVVRRRGGSGERGAAERAAAEQGLARGLGGTNGPGQQTGPF